MISQSKLFPCVLSCVSWHLLSTSSTQTPDFLPVLAISFPCYCLEQPGTNNRLWSLTVHSLFQITSECFSLHGVQDCSPHCPWLPFSLAKTDLFLLLVSYFIPIIKPAVSESFQSPSTCVSSDYPYLQPH